MLLPVVLLAFQPAPPLAFDGFRPGMSLPEATALITRGRGELHCRRTTDPRLRECTGRLPRDGIPRPFEILISSVRDSAAVIVLTGTPSAELARSWIENLAVDYGQPVYRAAPATQRMWQWVKRGRMLRVIVRTEGESIEASVTLTHGPLLDGLGAPEIKKPD